MAGFCGLMATALTMIVAGMLVLTAIADWTHQQATWRAGNDKMNVAAKVTSTAEVCGPDKPSPCPILKPDTARPTLKAYVSGLIGKAVMQAPLAALAYGLFQACACFVGFARGRLLARRTVDQLVRFALAGLGFVLLSPFAAKLGGLATDGSRKLMDIVTGDRSVLFSVSTYTASYAGVSNVLTVIYAVTLTLIALIMVKAAAIADDHAQIV
ncbi:hypothetical protein [Caulobacter sp.]|uniref:hypothetical protein n=1 Tax=Caulobacter sp. TaxID=78 RepID=UPI0025C57CB5|nr:hypothetical protein [Caulobacter sp.]